MDVPTEQLVSESTDGPDWDGIRAEKNWRIAVDVAYKCAIELRKAARINDKQFWTVVQEHAEKLASLEVGPENSKTTVDEGPPFGDSDYPA